MSSESMPVWNSQDAKAKFAQLVQESQERDQLITNREVPIAVVLGKERYDQLVRKSDSLFDFFSSAPLQDVDLDISRHQDYSRIIDL